jgi:heat shock protein HslJ
MGFQKGSGDNPSSKGYASGISFISGLAAGWLGVLMVTCATAAEWHIAALNGEATAETPFVRFANDGAFSGNTGCNSFHGMARREGGDLVIDGPVAATRMACPGDSLAAQDDAIIALFDGSVSVGFDPLRDALSLSNGQTILDLKRETSSTLILPETHSGLDRPAGDPTYLNPFGLADDLPIHAEPNSSSDVVGGAFSGQVLRNEGCSEGWCRIATLDRSVSGWAQQQYLEASGSALRAGQGVFDAAGAVPCAKGDGAPTVPCAMGVALDGGGSATVVVIKPDGIDRLLFFTDGSFVSADTSEAGGGFEISATRESDLNLIRVDDERYEIPDAVLFGG